MINLIDDKIFNELKGVKIMTSTSFIKEVAAKGGISQKAAREISYVFEDVLRDFLSRGESVKVMDVNYAVKDVEARTGRNPATGEAIDIPATKKVLVKASSTLKNFVKL